MWLDATRQGAADPAANGLRPTNVPRQSLKAQLTRDLPGLPGMQAQARVVHEGSRMVLPDNSIEAPAWTRLDVGLRWAFDAAGAAWVARAGIDNLTDERAWRDTPYQFGHAYLFPLPGRSVADVTRRAVLGHPAVRIYSWAEFPDSSVGRAPDC